MSSPISPLSPAANGGRLSSWQERLQEHCKSARLHPPVWNIVSDRRGGRTAWSSTVTVSSSNAHNAMVVSARYWYDGQYVNNAKEDAAEVALQSLLNAQGVRSPGPAPSAYQGQVRGW